MRLTFAVLGSDQDNPVCTPRTVNGSSRSILQHINGGNIFRSTVLKSPSTPSIRINGVVLPLTEMTPRRRIVEVAFGSPDPLAMLNPATLP